MAIAGGTASVLGGGKFSNGAFGGAMTHLYNHEARVSVSMSGGAGTGGTYEKGLSIAHDDNKPWYTGWTVQPYTTKAAGFYTDGSASLEVNIGWSDGQTTDVVLGSGYTVGFSANTTILPINGSAGYENFIPNGGGVVLHNASLGIDTPGGLAAEGHAYYGTTTKGW